MSYNSVVRELLSNGLEIPLDRVYKQAQNQGFISPSHRISWASYQLVTPQPQAYPYKFNERLAISYQLAYNLSIYGDDNLDRYLKLIAYLHTYPATIILHKNNMQFKSVEQGLYFNELVNNVYYNRLDAVLNFVARYEQDNEGTIDPDTVIIAFNNGRG